MPTEVLRVAPVILVRDLQSSLQYWNEKIGFSIERQFGSPVNFAMPYRGEVTLMLVQTPHGKTPPTPNWKIAGATNNAYIWVKGIDELYAELQTRGATIDYTLYNTPWGTREFGIQDLDENDITFGEIVEPR